MSTNADRDLKPGDTISVEFQVRGAYPLGRTVTVDGGLAELSFDNQDVTFVSRPEPTYAVELTASEVTALRKAAAGDVFSNGDAHALDTSYVKLFKATQ